VLDLAQAHILALQALQNGQSRTYNLGNGQGYSILELIEVARKITGHPIPAEVGPRRPGDPAILIASADSIRQELGWQPKHSDLETIVGDAWRWSKDHPNGYTN
jgi:UDP-glucose 4-epimerase